MVVMMVVVVGGMVVVDRWWWCMFAVIRLLCSPYWHEPFGKLCFDGKQHPTSTYLFRRNYRSDVETCGTREDATPVVV